MGLYKKGNSNWYAAFSANGRHFNRSTGTSNKRLARKILDSWRAEVIEGRFNLLKSTSPTLKDWATQFVEAIRHPSTQRRYKVSQVSLDDFFKDDRLQHVTVGRIEEFKRYRFGESVKAATVNRDLALLRQLLKRAERERFIARNPFDIANLFLEERRDRRQPHILTYAEEARLLAVSGPMLRALIIFLVESGLRVGKEAMPMKWADIDFSNDSIYVGDSKTQAGRRRLVPLSAYCKAELLRWREMTGPAFSEYVFFYPLNPAKPLLRMPKTWRRALKKAKIEYFPIGNLRHTFATRMQEAGTSPITLSQMMGHSTTGIIQTYAKVVDEYRRDAVRKLEEYRQSKVVDQTATADTNTHIN
jgi:integrase